MRVRALFSKGKTMSDDTQSAPDTAFLRTIGITLLTLAVATGAISIVGCLATTEISISAQLPESNGAIAGSILIQPTQIIIHRPEE